VHKGVLLQLLLLLPKEALPIYEFIRRRRRRLRRRRRRIILLLMVGRNPSSKYR